MQTLYVLDASGYLYRSYFGIHFMTNSRGESTNALFGFARSLLKLQKDFHPGHFVAIFDGPCNSKKRQELYAAYKANRTATPPDLVYQIQWAQQLCDLMGIPYLTVPNVEADDTMGSVALWAAKQGAIVYLCTGDKDLCQLVSDNILLLNTYKENQILGAKEVELVHGVPPSQIVDFLAITGDSSDNIPGLPGFGPKTAIALLRQFGSLDNILQNVHLVPGKKKQEILAEHANQAILSRNLVVLDTSVSFPEEIEFFRLKPVRIAALKEFYFEMNFNSLLRELEHSDPSAINSLPRDGKGGECGDRYTMVDDANSLAHLLRILSGAKEVCFNTQASGLRPMEIELIGVGFCVEEKVAWYIPCNGNLGREKVLVALKTIFSNPHTSFYGHDVKYSTHALANSGISLPRICFDTVLASYLLDSHSRQHGLDFLMLVHFGKVHTAFEDLVGKGKSLLAIADVPLDKMLAYSAQEVDYTCRLKSILEEQLIQRNLLSLFADMELPLLCVLGKMERCGVFVDISLLGNLSIQVTQQIAILEQEIYRLVGEEFNINSPKQLSAILFDKMGIEASKKIATGNSTDADVLEGLADKHPLAGKILEYRTLEKLRSTYIDTLPLEVYPKTQRIHCTFNQFVTATGRLSCQNPNLQNIPIKTEAGREIRRAFLPQKEGWSFLGADYSQIELRLLAHFSGDPNLVHAFANGEDVHVHTAAEIFDVHRLLVTKEQRQSAKAVNFGIIYGQQPFGLAQELHISTKKAATFIETYFKRFKRVKEYLDECKELARKSGKATTYKGRERLIPEINSKNALLKGAAERLAVNTPIQGSAADIIKLAMLEIDRKLSQINSSGYMILQIHDELLFELPDTEIATIEPLVKQAMQGVITLNIPLIVDIAIGKNWKEC